MKNIDEIKASLAELLDLPRDVIVKLPNIYLLGNLSLMVENQRGLLKYTTDEIKIRLYQGQLLITGDKLAIGMIKEDSVLINGEINNIAFKFD